MNTEIKLSTDGLLFSDKIDVYTDIPVKVHSPYSSEYPNAPHFTIIPELHDDFNHLLQVRKNDQVIKQYVVRRTEKNTSNILLSRVFINDINKVEISSPLNCQIYQNDQNKFVLAAHTNKDPQHAQILVTENGKVLLDTSLNDDPNDIPVAAFVNYNSGGGLGKQLVNILLQLGVKTFQLIGEKGKTEFVKYFTKNPNLRVLLCGGDGTITWGMKTLSDLGEKIGQIPVGIIPLGTANEVSRCTGWGNKPPKMKCKDVNIYLEALRTKPIFKYDVWNLHYLNKEENKERVNELQRYNTMTAFFSVGVDALIAKNFDKYRNEKLEKGKNMNRVKNKLAYIQEGIKQILNDSDNDVKGKIRVFADDKEVPLENFNSIVSFQVLNVNSMSDGVNFFGDRLSRKDELLQHYNQPKLNDGLLELTGISTLLDYNFNRVNCLNNSERFAQPSTIRFNVLENVDVQVDGEAFELFPNDIVTFNRKCKMNMVYGGKANAHAFKGINFTDISELVVHESELVVHESELVVHESEEKEKVFKRYDKGRVLKTRNKSDTTHSDEKKNRTEGLLKISGGDGCKSGACSKD